MQASNEREPTAPFETATCPTVLNATHLGSWSTCRYQKCHWWLLYSAWHCLVQQATMNRQHDPNEVTQPAQTTGEQAAENWYGTNQPTIGWRPELHKRARDSSSCHAPEQQQAALPLRCASAASRPAWEPSTHTDITVTSLYENSASARGTPRRRHSADADRCKQNWKSQ